MNKKTFFKISATALILGVSITLSVKYFPAVALAIKSGVIASAAPLVAFAIFTIIALASAAAFIKFVASAIRSKNTQGRPNGVEESRSKNKEGQSVKVVSAPTPSLLPHVTEEVTGTVLQQPDNNLTKDMETPQPEKDDGVVVNGDSAEQQITLESLNSLPYPSMSPLDTENQDQPPPPAPPSIVMDGHNGSRDANNPVQNHEQQDEIPIPARIRIALPAFERGREVGQQIALSAFECGRKVGQQNMLNALKPLLQKPSHPANGEEEDYKSLPLPDKEGEEEGEYEDHHSLPIYNQFMEINDSQVRHIIHIRKYGDNFWGSDFDSLSSNVSCNGPNSLLPTEQHLDPIAEERDSGPEKLLDVRLTHSVHGNSRSVVNGNSRNN